MFKIHHLFPPTVSIPMIQMLKENNENRGGGVSKPPPGAGGRMPALSPVNSLPNSPTTPGSVLGFKPAIRDNGVADDADDYYNEHNDDGGGGVGGGGGGGGERDEDGFGFVDIDSDGDGGSSGGDDSDANEDGDLAPVPASARVTAAVPAEVMPVGPVDGEWSCTTCGRSNDPKLYKCRVCTAAKPAEKGYWDKQAEAAGESPRKSAAMDAVERAKRMASGGDETVEVQAAAETEDDRLEREKFESGLVRRASAKKLSAAVNSSAPPSSLGGGSCIIFAIISGKPV